MTSAASHLFLPGLAETCLWEGGIQGHFYDTKLNNVARRVL